MPALNGILFIFKWLPPPHTHLSIYLPMLFWILCITTIIRKFTANWSRGKYCAIEEEKRDVKILDFKLALRLDTSVSSTEKDIDTRLTKAWTAIDRLSIIWKSDLTDKMKRSFFQAAVVSILLYGCTTWTLTKRLERRLDGNYTRMLRAVLNTPRDSNYTDTCPPSQKLYKFDEPDTRDTAGEARTSS